MDGWIAYIQTLKKAFNKVPHRRLLWKLEHIAGLKGTLKNWMEHYLKGREMKRGVKDEKSEWIEVKNGVPQGSVLAPIMFFSMRKSHDRSKQLHKCVCRW